MQLEASYDDWADTYGRMYNGPHEPINEARRSIGTLLRKKLGTGRILEVGCGIGFVTAGLAEDGFDVCGIDISARSLERAERLLIDLGLDARVNKQDILTLTPENPFDAVVAVGSLLDGLLSAENQHKALSSMVNALRPGDYLVIGLHDYE